MSRATLYPPPTVVAYPLHEPFAVMVAKAPDDPLQATSRVVRPNWADALRTLEKMAAKLMVASPLPEELRQGLRDGVPPSGHYAWLGVADAQFILMVAPERWCQERHRYWREAEAEHVDSEG